MLLVVERRRPSIKLWWQVRTAAVSWHTQWEPLCRTLPLLQPATEAAQTRGPARGIASRAERRTAHAAGYDRGPQIRSSIAQNATMRFRAAHNGSYVGQATPCRRVGATSAIGRLLVGRLDTIGW